MDRLKLLATKLLRDSHCDAVAVGLLDFNNHTFHCFEVMEGDIDSHTEGIYFDLASLTKPLTNSFVHIANNINDPKLELLLNHRAGLPSWGLLSTSNWKEQLLSYPIKESETNYSDFSANRYMLEVEKQLDQSYPDIVYKNFAGQIYNWLTLPESKVVLQNGYYVGKANFGKVHDPNAYNIKEFMSHAGLFGTIESVCRALVEFDKEYDLLGKMDIPSPYRFFNGFDTVANPDSTLAGAGCGPHTFGHLGFTGTSFWIDPSKKVGHVILTNSTKYHWFSKKELNQFRRELGEKVWADQT